MTYTNKDRVESGRFAVRAGSVGRYNDLEGQLVDALANIMHYAAAYESINFEAALARARGFFYAESPHDEPEPSEDLEDLTSFYEDLADRVRQRWLDAASQEKFAMLRSYIRKYDLSEVRDYGATEDQP